MVEFDDPGAMTDAELIGALMAIDGEPSDPTANALRAEIERRRLEVCPRMPGVGSKRAH